MTFEGEQKNRRGINDVDTGSKRRHLPGGWESEISSTSSFHGFRNQDMGRNEGVPWLGPLGWPRGSEFPLGELEGCRCPESGVTGTSGGPTVSHTPCHHRGSGKRAVRGCDLGGISAGGFRVSRSLQTSGGPFAASEYLLVF